MRRMHSTEFKAQVLVSVKNPAHRWRPPWFGASEGLGRGHDE
jgi:hypothetical protein